MLLQPQQQSLLECWQGCTSCTQDPLGCVAPTLELSESPAHVQGAQQHVPSLCSLCPLNTSHFSSSLCEVLRCSFSSLLKNMIWRNPEHIHTWHGADAPTDAGECYRRVCCLSITDQRELGLPSAEQTELHKVKLPRAHWGKLTPQLCWN